MRGLVVVLAVAMMSGCLSQSSDTNEPAAETPTADSPHPARTGVEIANQVYQAAAEQPATFMIDVPAGAVNVLFKVGTKVVVPGTGATVTLEGCGESSVTWGSIGIAGGNNWQNGSLCTVAKSGSHKLTVEALAVPLTGNVVIIADIP